MSPPPSSWHNHVQLFTRAQKEFEIMYLLWATVPAMVLPYAILGQNHCRTHPTIDDIQN